jgi:hypothetical protein
MRHAAGSLRKSKVVAEDVMLKVAVREEQSLEEEVGCAERAARHHRIAQLLGHLHTTLTCVHAVINVPSSVKGGFAVHHAVQTPCMSEWTSVGAIHLCLSSDGPVAGCRSARIACLIQSLLLYVRLRHPVVRVHQKRHAWRGHVPSALSRHAVGCCRLPIAYGGGRQSPVAVLSGASVVPCKSTVCHAACRLATSGRSQSASGFGVDKRDGPNRRCSRKNAYRISLSAGDGGTELKASGSPAPAQVICNPAEMTCCVVLLSMLDTQLCGSTT